MGMIVCSEQGTVFIYALVDPDTRAYCYVGATGNPKGRLANHIRQYGDTNEKASWVRLLRCRCQKPEMKILEEVAAAESLEAEQRWIQDLRAAGHRLLNR